MIFLTVYYTSGLRKTGHDTGDWSNGMIGVSKTFGGSSILSSPAIEKPWKQRKIAVFKAFVRYARRATAVLARAGIRRATVIERQCREMSEVSRLSDRGRKLPLSDFLSKRRGRKEVILLI